MSWSEIAFIICAVLLLIGGGHIRRLVNETKDLVDVIAEALEDNSISNEELLSIVKEAKDVKSVILDIIKLIVRRDGK